VTVVHVDMLSIVIVVIIFRTRRIVVKKTSTHATSIKKKLTSAKSVGNSSETHIEDVYVCFAWYIGDCS